MTETEAAAKLPGYDRSAYLQRALDRDIALSHTAALLTCAAVQGVPMAATPISGVGGVTETLQQRVQAILGLYREIARDLRACGDCGGVQYQPAPRVREAASDTITPVPLAPLGVDGHSLQLFTPPAQPPAGSDTPPRLLPSGEPVMDITGY